MGLEWKAALTLASLAVITACTKTPPAPTRVLLSRDEFALLCPVGKDYTDCVKGVGQPDRTQTSSGTSTEYWYWIRRTRDPRTGQPDLQAQAVIESGWVRAVNFN
jgi:hypothetical protein